MQTVNLGKVRGDDGASVFIKYANDLSGSGATDIYSGQKYIGVKVSKDANTGSYQWMKFIGDNGAAGQNCYIRFNTSASDSGATLACNGWASGQNYIGFIMSEATTAPTSGYTWCKFIPETTSTPTNGSTMPFSAGGAYTEFSKKASNAYCIGINSDVAQTVTNRQWNITSLNGDTEYFALYNNGIRILKSGIYDISIEAEVDSQNNVGSTIWQIQANGISTLAIATSLYTLTSPIPQFQTNYSKQIIQYNAGDILTLKTIATTGVIATSYSRVITIKLIREI